jgi:RNA polymerase sigma-70 factor (ECF subfamily)
MRAYEDCHEAFTRYCSAMAHARMDAEDLMQDVLLSAFHHFHRIERPDELLHYLLRAAKNRTISNWRASRRTADVEERQMARLHAQGVSAETLLDVQLLYRALDKLPADQREALLLFEVTGLPMAEIALVQNSSEGAVKTRVSRARAALRELLSDRPTTANPARIRTLLTLITLLP